MSGEGTRITLKGSFALLKWRRNILPSSSFFFRWRRKKKKSSLINSFASSETEKNARSFIPFFFKFSSPGWYTWPSSFASVYMYEERRGICEGEKKRGKLCKVQKVITIPLHLSRVVLRRCLLYFLWYLSYIFS